MVASWEGTVSYAEGPGGQYAYRPRQVIVRDDAAAEAAAVIVGRGPDASKDEDGFWTLTFEGDVAVHVPSLVAELRARGFQAQPNHVLFAHCTTCGCCPPHPSLVFGNPMCANPLYANPLYANPLYANPLYANPLYANPLYANPLYANPLYANPLYANPLYANPAATNPAGPGTLGDHFRLTGQRKSSARPASKPPRLRPQGQAAPQVFVLDSGLAINQGPTGPGGKKSGEKAQLPELLDRLDAVAAVHRDAPDDDADLDLDPVAGHGTFIAGVIEQLLPGVPLRVWRVMASNLGDTDETRLRDGLDSIAAAAAGGEFDAERGLINLSLGGQLSPETFFLPEKIRKLQRLGIVVVASAGNDGSCVPAYPAALAGVVSVGALGTMGPAPFTNYGPWVRACAPGVGLVSSFFRNFNGLAPAGPEGDPDKFAEWAKWSGTSFAAPVVVAALAREIALTGCTAQEAVERVIDAPNLFRIPGLGTVVNLA